MAPPTVPPAPTAPTPPAAPLAALPPLLRQETALARVVGLADATLAVPGPAQAFVLAGLARLSDRRPLLVVTATATAAERLAGDLACFVPPDDASDDAAAGTDGAGGGAGARQVGALADPVALLPAWETLPFERVSPDVGTMGQRMAALWHLGAGHLRDTAAPAAKGAASGIDGLAGPRIVVASVRAMLQRLVPWDEMPPPLVVRAGAVLDAAATVAALVAAGYRREHQVEHRGEVAVRGGIIDVFPSTSDRPVRLDLWGDEVDRLTVFDGADQRSIGDLDSVAVFGCRELLPTPAVRARAAELVDSEPWGRAQWEKLVDGQVFDGMESWLPWLHPAEHLLTDLLPPEAQVVLVEPRRVRDRAVDLVDEEAALADTLAATWGATGAGERFPRLYLPFDRLLAESSAPVLSLVSVADGPATPGVTVRGFDPVAGDPSRLASQVTGLVDGGYSVTLCSPTDAGAGRLSTVLAEEGVVAPLSSEAVGSPGVRVVAAPLGAGFAVPDARVAVLSESDVTGRRTPHRPARPRARPTDGFFDDLAPGSYVVHRQHGVARYAGVTTRTVGGTTRDYLVLEYRGSDRLYLPVDQIEAVTPYSGGESPTLSKMGGADWQRARAKARAAAGEIADELVELYRRRAAVEGHAFGPDTPWQAEMEGAFAYTPTADQLRTVAEVKADMEQPRPMDRLVCGDV
ncbi:MAG TPA: CarD family transcriptional regulator, partial [Acidimicrobiales bacterium]